MNRNFDQMLSNSVYLPIKTETNSVCYGCLSENRALAPLGKLRDLFYRVINREEKDEPLGAPQLWQTEPHLCWECLKVLRNTHRLRERVYEAQQMMHLAQGSLQGCGMGPPTLSTLSESHKEVYDYHFIHDNSEPTIESLKKELEDDISELEFDYKEADFNCDVEIKEFDGYGDQKPETCKQEDRKVDLKVPKSRKARKKKVYLKPKLEPTDGDIDDTFTRIYTTKSEWEEERRKKAERDEYSAAELKCEKCILVFRKARLLLNHDRSVHDPKHMFKCDICPAQLETESKLQVHKRTHAFYKCNMCEYKTMRIEYFYNHYENSHTYNIKCMDCEDVFPSRRALDAHVRERHSAFVCDHCGKVARSKDVIARHIHNAHMPAFCKICEQPFKSVKAIRAHNKLKHTHVQSDATYCVECDITFATGALYRSHVRMHHGKKYPCPECKKSYKTNWHLRSHYSYFHERRTQHYCAECDKYFIRKFALDRHIRRMHHQQKVVYPKKHICEHCSRGFAWIRDLVQHVRTHTGERPHACALCPARFAQESPLVTHARRVHGMTGGFREILEANDMKHLAEGSD